MCVSVYVNVFVCVRVCVHVPVGVRVSVHVRVCASFPSASARVGTDIPPLQRHESPRISVRPTARVLTRFRVQSPDVRTQTWPLGRQRMDFGGDVREPWRTRAAVWTVAEARGGLGNPVLPAPAGRAPPAPRCTLGRVHTPRSALQHDPFADQGRWENKDRRKSLSDIGSAKKAP